MNRDNFAQIPRLAQRKLNPYESVLFNNYVDTCGFNNNPCTKSNKTLATETGMSPRRVVYARKKLMEMGYITVVYLNQNSTPRVTIDLDIWQDNHEFCSPANRAGGGAQDATRGASNATGDAQDATNQEVVNNNQDQKPIKQESLVIQSSSSTPTTTYPTAPPKNDDDDDVKTDVINPDILMLFQKAYHRMATNSEIDELNHMLRQPSGEVRLLSIFRRIESECIKPRQMNYLTVAFYNEPSPKNILQMSASPPDGYNPYKSGKWASIIHG